MIDIKKIFEGKIENRKKERWGMDECNIMIMA